MYRTAHMPKYGKQITNKILIYVVICMSQNKIYICVSRM